jgi:predicted Zn-dependent peptidase
MSTNNLRLAYIFSPGSISHCALMIGAGGRDEPENKPGLAHFLEHVMFKGTKNRNAYQVLNRLEVVGGELNAYTTKEETCIHASVLNEHFERAAELISDIVFHPTFPEKEIKKEKEVVLDEIHSYLDNPTEQIFDDFESMIFTGHPLGKPILGTESSVKSFTRRDVTGFVSENYLLSRMVFSYCGNLPLEKVEKMVKKYFSIGNNNSFKSSTIAPGKKTAKHLTENRNVSHAHLICGSKAYPLKSNKRFALYQLNNILGGPGMNSRLNMNIRERNGLTYHVESGYAPFKDTGLFHVYLASDTKHLNRCIDLVNKEFRKLKEEKISPAQMTRYKYQLKGQIAISQENRAGVMLNNAKSVLNYNKPLNITELFKKIDAVTPQEVMDVANEMLQEKKLSSLVYLPK